MNKERIAKIEEARKRIKRLVDNESVEHRTEIIRNRFIHRLHEFMEKKSISKKDLSESIGTSQSYISQIFNGTKPLNLSTIAKIELKYPIEFKVELRENDNTEWNEEPLVKFISSNIHMRHNAMYTEIFTHKSTNENIWPTNFPTVKVSTTIETSKEVYSNTEPLTLFPEKYS